MQQRNGIEGTISELIRGHGLRRARYKGFAKVDLQNQFVAAACNVKRWLQKLVKAALGTDPEGNFIVREALSAVIGLTLSFLNRLLLRLRAFDPLPPALS